MLKDKYIEYISGVRRYSERTCAIYRDVLEMYEKFAGQYPGSLSQSAIRAYEVHLLDDCGLSARTVAQHLSVLSGFCRFLMREGLLSSNPAHLVSRPKQEKRLQVFYREESMRSYFESTQHDADSEQLELLRMSLQDTKLARELYSRRLRRLIISILYSTGVRRSELISMNVGSVDFSRKVIRIKGKGDKTREVPVLESLCDEISMYLEASTMFHGDADSPNSPLLMTPEGGRLYPVFVDRAVKTELGTTDITGRKSPHVLRHTLATELLGDGADLNSIKELLGHSSLAATQVYTHNTVERLQSAYNAAHPRAGKPKD